jgi:hypothetical protein
MFMALASSSIWVKVANTLAYCNEQKVGRNTTVLKKLGYTISTALECTLVTAVTSNPKMFTALAWSDFRVGVANVLAYCNVLMAGPRATVFGLHN